MNEQEEFADLPSFEEVQKDFGEGFEEDFFDLTDEDIDFEIEEKELDVDMKEVVEIFSLNELDILQLSHGRFRKQAVKWGGTLIAAKLFLIYLARKHDTYCIFVNPDLDDWRQTDFVISIDGDAKENVITKTESPYEAKDYKELFARCRENNKFGIIPLIQVIKRKGKGTIRHENIMIYNPLTNEMEHYETYGPSFGGAFFFAQGKLWDDALKGALKDFWENKVGIKYIEPNIVCPLNGLQKLEEDKSIVRDKLDPIGFCLAWSYYIADLRLTHPTVDKTKLVQAAIDALDSDPQKMREFIRGYSTIVRDVAQQLSLDPILQKIVEKGIVADLEDNLTDFQWGLATIRLNDILVETLKSISDVEILEKKKIIEEKFKSLKEEKAKRKKKK